MTKQLIEENDYLGLTVSGLEFMTIMAGSMAVSRQAWTGAVAERSHLEAQAQSR